MLYWLQKNSVQEGFLEFIPLQSATSESIATELREHLAAIVPEDQQSKLICQAYDGASVMRGAAAGVQRKIKDAYPKCLLYPPHFRRENFFFWPRWICQLFFQDHPSEHVFLITCWSVDCQHPAASERTFTAKPSTLCLSTGRISFAVLRTHETWLWPQYHQRGRILDHATGTSGL